MKDTVPKNILEIFRFYTTHFFDTLHFYLSSFIVLLCLLSFIYVALFYSSNWIFPILEMKVKCFFYIIHSTECNYQFRTIEAAIPSIKFSCWYDSIILNGSEIRTPQHLKLIHFCTLCFRWGISNLCLPPPCTGWRGRGNPSENTSSQETRTRNQSGGHKQMLSILEDQ
jgi:hypothetical protein